MKFSSLADRLSGHALGTWHIHSEALRRRSVGEEVILLTVGNPDQAAPASVIEATIQALRQGRTHYAPVLGDQQLRAALAQRIEHRTGVACSWENVAVTPGAQGGLFFSMMALAQTGDEVVIPEPMYATYPGVVAGSGATLIPVAMRSDAGFQLDVNAVVDAVTSRTRVIWINSPNNPTGAVYHRDAIAALGEFCLQNNIWLLSDEVYEDMAFGREHTSVWSLAGLPSRVIVGSLSKSHAMPGFRFGWVAGPRSLIDRLQGLLLAGQYGGPPFIQAGVLAGLQSDLSAATAIRDIYAARALKLQNILMSAPHCRVLPPEGGMFVLLDVRGTGLSGTAFASGLLERHGVALLPCEGFGPSAAGHVRISLGTPTDLLCEAGDRIVAYAAALPATME